ncbi:outer membrane beta-barrel protein [Spirosoma fluminis]
MLGQGRLNIGVGVSGGYGGFVGNSGHVVPRLQYFLTDGWSVSLEGRYDINSGSQTKFMGGGLSTRYYVLRTRRFAVFGQLGATYGQSRYYADANGPNKYGSGTPQYTGTFQTNAGLGVHYRLGNRWSLEAGSERVLTNSTQSTIDASPWRANIGLNFRIR